VGLTSRSTHRPEQAVHNVKVHLRAAPGLARVDPHNCGAMNGSCITTDHGLHGGGNDQMEFAHDQARPSPTAVHWHDERAPTEHKAVA